MKKISIYSYAMLCAMIANTALPSSTTSSAPVSKTSGKNFLGQFEQAKQEAIASPNEKADEAKGEWDKIVETLQDVIKQVQTLKKANHVSLQHEAVARKAESDLGKDLDGKTKSSAASYRAIATAGNEKIRSVRKGMNEISQNLLKRTETAVKAVKNANAEDTKAHNKTQGDIADLDAKKATEEPTKHSKDKVLKPRGKEPKEKAEALTREEKQAKKDARIARKRKKIAQ